MKRHNHEITKFRKLTGGFIHFCIFDFLSTPVIQRLVNIETITYNISRWWKLVSYLFHMFLYWIYVKKYEDNNIIYFLNIYFTLVKLYSINNNVPIYSICCFSLVYCSLFRIQCWASSTRGSQSARRSSRRPSPTPPRSARLLRFESPEAGDAELLEKCENSRRCGG